MSYVQTNDGRWKALTVDSGASHTVAPKGPVKKKVQPEEAEAYAKIIEERVRKQLSGEPRQESHP